MDKDQRIAFIQSQTLCAYAELEAMKASNAEDAVAGRPMTYRPSHFASVPDRFCLGHNDVVTYLLGQ